MNHADAKTLALDLMKKHLSPDWKFAWLQTKTSVGRCEPRTKLIKLNYIYTHLASEEDVKDTILHEIAHALTPGAHHGWSWRIACRQVGARPCRTAKYDNQETMQQFASMTRKYVSRCSCGKIYHKSNSPAGRTYVCIVCRTPLVWNTKQKSTLKVIERPAMPEPTTPYVAPPVNQPDPNWLKEKREAEIRLKKMMEDI